MNFKSLSLVAAIVSASLFSASAFAAPLVCKAGKVLVTVKSVGPVKSGVLLLGLIVNATKEDRNIPYHKDQLKAMKLNPTVGLEFCIEESEVL